MIVYLNIIIPTKWKMFKSLLFFPDKIYTDIDAESNPDYIRACDKSAIKLLKSSIVTISIMIGTAIIYATFPIVNYFMKSDAITCIDFPIPAYFPFTDLETKTGLIINILNQFFICGIGITGNVSIELINCLLKNTVWASYGAIGHSVDELTKLINKSESVVTVSCHFKHILMQIQDYDR